MKKLMVVVVALAAGVLSGAFADEVTSTRWIGPDGQQDWNQPANWSAGVPSGTMDAVFIPIAANYVHRLAPPAEFTGRILVSNETAIATTDKTKPQSAMLMLDVVAGAQWTVGGNGQVVATEGIGARLGPNFNGRVEVPCGSSFTVPEGLSASVQYLGQGTLTLSSTNQLRQVSGFTGELVLPGDADLQDIAQIQGKKVRLAAGANLNLAESMLALNATERISPFAEGGWSLNGGRTSAGAIFEPEFRDGPAYVLDNGDLQLVDDPAQVHSAIYTNRMFKLYDDFGVKFTWRPSLPSDSRMAKAGKGQIWSGWFQVGLQTSTPDNCSRKREIPVTNFYGVGFYCYRTSDNTQHLVWHDNTTLDGYPTYYNMPERELGGIVFTKPIDIAMACSDGLLTVTLCQDGVSKSLQRSIRSFLAGRGKGAWLSIGGSSDYWGDANANVPWMQMRLSGFEGWCRTRSAAPWQTVSNISSYYPFSDANWKFKFQDSQNGISTNSSEFVGRSADEKSFQLMQGIYQGQLAQTLTALKTAKRYRVSFDLDWPEHNGSGEGISFGFCKNPATVWTFTQGKRDNTAAPYRYWPYVTEYWHHKFAIYQDLWSSRLHLLYDVIMKDSAGKDVWVNYTLSSGSYSACNVCTQPAAASRTRYEMYYDATGNIVLDMSRVPVSGTVNGGTVNTQAYNMQKDRYDAWKTKGDAGAANMYFYLASGSANWCYLPITVSSFHVEELVGNTSPRLDSSLAVADGQSSTVTVGASDTAAATPAATVAQAMLGAASVLNIASATASANMTIDQVTANGAATLAAGTGASLKLGALTLTGEPGESRLTVTGTATAADSLKVVVPSSWCKSSTGKVTLLSGVSVDPENVTLETEDGPVPAKRATLLLENGALMADFSRGMVLIFR